MQTTNEVTQQKTLKPFNHTELEALVSFLMPSLPPLKQQKKSHCAPPPLRREAAVCLLHCSDVNRRSLSETGPSVSPDMGRQRAAHLTYMYNGFWGVVNNGLHDGRGVSEIPAGHALKEGDGICHP